MKKILNILRRLFFLTFYNKDSFYLKAFKAHNQSIKFI